MGGGKAIDKFAEGENAIALISNSGGGVIKSKTEGEGVFGLRVFLSNGAKGRIENLNLSTMDLSLTNLCIKNSLLDIENGFGSTLSLIEAVSPGTPASEFVSESNLDIKNDGTMLTDGSYINSTLNIKNSADLTFEYPIFENVKLNIENYNGSNLEVLSSDSYGVFGVGADLELDNSGSVRILSDFDVLCDTANVHINNRKGGSIFIHSPEAFSNGVTDETVIQTINNYGLLTVAGWFFIGGGGLVINNFGIFDVTDCEDIYWDVPSPILSNAKDSKVLLNGNSIFSGSYTKPEFASTGTEAKNITIISSNNIISNVKTETYQGAQIIQTGQLTLADFNLLENSSWEQGSSIVFTDIAEGTDLAKSISDQIKSRLGDSVRIQFTGSVGGVSSISSSFDIKVIHSLISEGKLSSGSVVTSEALTHTGKAFTLGNTGDMTQDTGFMGIQGSTGITVKDGKTLTLMGSQAPVAMAVGADTRDANYVITDAPMTLTNGNLNLGHANLSATEGTLAAVTYDNQSNVNVNNGIFTFASLKGNGAVTISESSRATVTGDFQTANATNSGTLTVNGKTTLSRNAVTGASTYAVNRNGFTNQKGTANFNGGLEIGKGTSLTNMAGATVNAGAITMNELGTINAVAGSTINATSFDQNGIMRVLGTLNVTGAMTVGDNSTTVLGGESNIGTLTVGKATPAKLSEGTGFYATPMGAQMRLTGKHYVDELNFVSGTVSVDDGAILTGKTLKGGTIGSTITVAKGGTFGFSHNKSSLDRALEGYVGDKADKAILALNTDLHFANGGSLTVGTVAGARGTVNLGSDSLLLLGTTDLHGEALLNGTSAQQLHVEDGATIAMTDDLLWGNHYILKGFDKPSSDEVMHVGIKDKDGKAMTLNRNDQGIFVTIGSSNILDKDKSFRLVNQMNWMLDGHQNVDAGQGDVGFLTTALLAKNGAEATNRMEALASDAGVMAETQRMTAQVQTTMLDHATSARKGHGTFWVDGVFADVDSGAFERTAGASSYDVDTTGFVFGADLPVADDYRLGVAFSAQRGDLDGQHGLSSDIEGYGLSVYGGYTFASGLNVAGSLSYLDTTHEVSAFNLGAVKANVDAMAWMLGGRVSMPYAFNRMWVTPYVGFDVMKINQDAFATSWSGKAAFNYAETDATILRTPVGVKAGTFVPLEMFGRSGTLNWDADLAFIPQFGDTEADYRVSGVSNGHSDAYDGTFANDWLSTLKLGMSWQGAAGAFGIHYGVEKGDVRDLSHSVKAKASLYF